MITISFSVRHCRIFLYDLWRSFIVHGTLVKSFGVKHFPRDYQVLGAGSGLQVASKNLLDAVTFWYIIKYSEVTNLGNLNYQISVLAKKEQLEITTNVMKVKCKFGMGVISPSSANYATWLTSTLILRVLLTFLSNVRPQFQAALTIIIKLWTNERCVSGFPTI